MGNYILDRHEPSRSDKADQHDYQGWLTSYKTASCKALSVRDAQLVTTLQALIYLSFCIQVVIITLVILVHNCLASYPYEMRGAFHSTELCVLLYQKTQLHPKGWFSLLLSLFLAITLYYLGHFLDLTNFFQIWSMPAGYEELAVGFEPVRSGEMF